MTAIKKSSHSCSRTWYKTEAVNLRYPKELLMIKNKPLIHYSVDECLSAGVENIAVVINKGKNGKAIEL